MQRDLEAAGSLPAIEDVRVAFLGRKGKITSLLQGIKDLVPEDRKRVGRLGNQLKGYAERALDEKAAAMGDLELEEALRREALDISLPGKCIQRGSRHLLSQIIEEIEDIFIGLGYQVVEGPEVELDYYNFEALNTPEWHPSKSLQDTFYIENPKGDYQDVLLRTQTSPVQVRVMETTPPPLYVISPGKAFRYDVPDATHSPMFHQVEGLVVDEGITLGDLKGTLEYFTKQMFGQERDIRFRPHFFPFTEPSAEVDVSCIICEGKGCRVCKGSGWLEILGCGMVDPNVYKYVGYDEESVSGFAFGMGVERIALLKYAVPDIRYFFDNDLRLLRQF
ncbi:MAG: phenylalanine--tRNA ligase subunit alpha [Candidatus Solincola sediminis]|uniref:Phenylalanine--tRNA ligase alpha subunit n=1 Tax=Candidatus Solincola sediminis TaxID=1797199 RepID=A0A1F2WGS8_9ACTN|nr:MAG: phenylalanine--tRNA ligase subunit alpha [Candidatus Solincola sediminis]OFW58309.1 MAG: phenylalanine--tRNA ligase subunit alpha [Candidatus Solincola sediminis]